MLVGHAALQLVMHACLHAVHGLLPPQAYLQLISSFSKSMHWVALASDVIPCIIPACVACAHWRLYLNRRMRKEDKEVQEALRKTHSAESRMAYGAALTSSIVFGNPGLLSRWGQTRWWDALRSCVHAPLVEEFLFRSGLLNALHVLFGARCARIWSSVLFGISHFGNHKVSLEASADIASHPRLLSAFILRVSSPTALLKRGGARRAWQSWALLARGPASTAPTSLTHHRLVTSSWVWAASHVALCSASAFWRHAPAYRDHGYIGAVCSHAVSNAASGWFRLIKNTFLPCPRTVGEITEAGWLRHWLYTWQGCMIVLTRRPSLLITMNKYFSVIVSKLREASPSRS